MATIADKILKRIRGMDRGSVCSAKDFLDLGSRAAVDQAMSRLVAKGQLRRLGRGVYDYPKMNPRLGVLTPSADALASALAKKTNSRLQISGAHAANALGLSTQVPAKVVYLTDGTSRRVRMGGRMIELRHASPRTMATAGRPSGTVIQALRYIGPNGIDDGVIDTVKRSLSNDDRVALTKDVKNAPDWMRPVLSQIASSSSP